MIPEYTPDNKNRSGWIEVITGSMFSGKTEELIRRLRRARLANQKVEIFKPIMDSRYSSNEIVSHDSSSASSIPVTSSSEILSLVNEVSVIGIDEAQFFDSGIVNVCNILANSGIRVVIAGLDMDYQGKPFGPLPQLMATAEYVTKLQAVCMRCGNPSLYSFRKTKNNDLILLGEKEEYEPLCRVCYNNLIQTVNASI